MKKMKISITASILTLLLLMAWASCSGSFIDPSLLEEMGGDLEGGFFGGGDRGTVTFNINGGSGTTPKPLRAKLGDTITLPAGSGFSRSGYTFGGWREDSPSTGKLYSAGSSYTVYKDVTLYAIWNENATISYETNPIRLTAGTWANGNITSVTNYEAWYSFNVTSGTTYYVWWNDRYEGNSTKTLDVKVSAKYSSNGSSIFTDEDSGWNNPTPFTATSDDTVKLCVTPYFLTQSGTFAIAYTTTTNSPTRYTVTFNINGGTGTTPSSQTVNPYNIVVLPVGSGLSKNGYTFGGWNTKADGSGTNYVANYSYPVNSNVTLYARWLPFYTVTFNINGGTGTTPSSQTTTSGYNISLPSGSGLSKSNYEFSGWNTNAAGSGISYGENSTYTVNGNVTLYAEWFRNSAYTTPIQLTAGTWANGIITSGSSPNNEAWFSFNVTNGTTYYVWWNDSFQGNSTKTSDVMVSAEYSDGSSVFTATDSAWDTPRGFLATSTGTVKLRVYSSNTGTFAIVYSTNSTRP
jgi:uncharacterized repeat protein (TIGR02543 family)